MNASTFLPRRSETLSKLYNADKWRSAEGTVRKEGGVNPLTRMGKKPDPNKGDRGGQKHRWSGNFP